MKILFVSTATPEHRIAGGIVSHLDLLRSRLVRRGHKVHCVAAEPADAGGSTPEHVTHVPPPLVYRVPIRYHLNLLSAFEKLETSFSPDVVHIHSQTGAAVALTARHTPVVTTVHAVDPPVSRKKRLLGQLIETAGRSANRRIVSGMLECSDKILVPSTKTADDLMVLCPGLARNALEVVSMGVDLDRFRPTGDPAEVKHRLGLGGGFTFLSVGRLTHLKGVEDLLVASKTVLSAIPDARFVIVGTGPAESRLKGMAAQLGLSAQVMFIGAVPNRELPSYYTAADVFVNPTRENETFGLATVEALACSKAVVVSAAGAATGIAPPGHALVYDNPQDLAFCLRRLHDEPELRNELSARARRCAERFGVEPMIDRLESCFETLVDSGKTRTAATCKRRWASFWGAWMLDGSVRWANRFRDRVSTPRTAAVQ